MFTKILWNKVEVPYFLLRFINAVLMTVVIKTFTMHVIQRINCFEKAGLFCLLLTSSDFSRQIMVHRTYHFVCHAKVHCTCIVLLNRT